MVELGSGIRLDEHFDFDVGSTGDLDALQGVRELEKDLAVRIVGALEYGEDVGVDAPASVGDGIVGQVLSMGVRSDTASTVGRIARSDDRIDRVVKIELTERQQRNTLEIDLLVQLTEEGRRTLSFETRI